MQTITRDWALDYQSDSQTDALRTYEQVEAYADATGGLVEPRCGLPERHTRSEYLNNYVLWTEQWQDGAAFATHERVMFTPRWSRDQFTRPGDTMWHELGHMHQLAAQQGWVSRSWETTANLWMIDVQRQLGQGSMVINDGPIGRVTQPGGIPDYEATFPDPYSYERLVPFEQLRLAYGDDFYPRFHRLLREQYPDTVVPNPDKDTGISNTITATSQAAGHDLTDFWDRWGIPVTTETRTRVAALGLPTPDTETLIRLPQYN